MKDKMIEIKRTLLLRLMLLAENTLVDYDGFDCPEKREDEKLIKDAKRLLSV